MRCFFISGGHVAGMSELEAHSDLEAIKEAARVFEAQLGQYGVIAE